ncbi:MAG TPA: O-antigen ligase family protein [Streptosporangiaceae bacterium]|nr:O-antigen ligase family protein [Streptosporangiaceae bacterium]
MSKEGRRGIADSGAAMLLDPAPSFGEPRGTASGKLDVVALLTAYLFLLMFIPSTLVFSPLGGVGTPSMVFSLFICLWYIASVTVGRISPSGGGQPIRVAMLAFFLAVLASVVAGMTRAITQVEALSADRGVIGVIAWAGLVVVVSRSVTTYGQLDKLLRRAVVFGAVVGAIGIFEYYSGINVTNYIHIPGLSLRVDINTLQGRNGLNRPSSTAIQPIEFGIVMAMLLPFALQQAFDSARTGGRIRKWLPVVLIGFAIPITVSRSGIVGALVGLIFLVPTWKPQRRRSFLAACLVGLGAVKLAAPGLLGTLITYFSGLFGGGNVAAGTDVSVGTRTADYSAAWQYIVQRPFFGRGFATFLPQVYRYTDNEYLHAMIEIGFVGLVVLLLVYLVGMHCAAAGRRRTQDEGRRDFGQAVVSSIVVAAVGSATFDSLSFPMYTGVLFLILGIAGAYLGIMTAESRSAIEAEMPTERTRSYVGETSAS